MFIFKTSLNSMRLHQRNVIDLLGILAIDPNDIQLSSNFLSFFQTHNAVRIHHIAS